MNAATGTPATALVVVPPPIGTSLFNRQLDFAGTALDRDFRRRPNGEIDDRDQENVRLALSKAEFLFGYDEFASVAYVRSWL